MNADDQEPTIDLNADFGEAVTPEGIAVEEAVVASVSSVNIACGGHAGDESSMRRSVRAAVAAGAVVGAHPSFPDPANFGRKRMDIDAASLRASIIAQLEALFLIAVSEGANVAHCKPHGALYHAASEDESVAEVILRACEDVDPALRLVGQAGSRVIEWWGASGAMVIEEAFADRRYSPEGRLVPRSVPESLITSGETAGEQAVRIALSQSVSCSDGSRRHLSAETLCLHSDTPGAAAIATEVRRRLEAAGVAVHPIP